MTVCYAVLPIGDLLTPSWEENGRSVAVKQDEQESLRKVVLSDHDERRGYLVVWRHRGKKTECCRQAR